MDGPSVCPYRFMIEKHFILATAGHVDHGKSALVKALTGTDPDRLPEEKKRGITIELGFAHFELKSPNESEVFSVGVIDVPGHEDFVKKMISGAGAIDLALLVIAADDGWMPQTEEHLQILMYLGLSRLVVALTKIDLVESPESTEKETRNQLRETPFVDAAIIKTARDGRGLTELRAQLAREFASLSPQADIAKPRLHVDRAFSLRGIGTVVTGTVLGGKFRRGESVVVRPGNLSARIRSLQNHNRDMEALVPGTRGALNLADVTIADCANGAGLRRGDVVTRVELGGPSLAIDIRLSRLARPQQTALPIRHGANVRLHHGSGNFSARVFFYDRQTLAPGESQLAQLRLTSPIFVFAGDRFVLRDASERQTLAGGIVLDADTSIKNFRTRKQRQFLEECFTSPWEVTHLVQAQIERDHVAGASQLCVKSCFSADDVVRATRALTAEGKIVWRGGFATDAKWWRTAVGKVRTLIDTEHQNHPETAGVGLAQIRPLFPNVPVPVFDALLGDIDDLERDGEVVRRKAHRAALTVDLQKVGQLLRSTLSVKPFDPPSRKELVRTADAEKALRFLIGTGEVVQIHPDVVLSGDAFEKMRDSVVRFLGSNRSATVSQLRELLGSSRRVMIPFLEQLDRERITRRVGDKRELF
jgi:selenocysteine-specific elongation factor